MDADKTTNLDGTCRPQTAREIKAQWLAVADHVGEEALEARGITPTTDGQGTRLPLGMVAELLAVAHQRDRDARERITRGEIER